MKKKILIMSALLSLVLSASAEDMMSIGLDNPDSEFTAFQFDLTLPEGLSFVLDKENAPICERGLRLDTSHQLQANVLNENRTIRVICFSLSTPPFVGTSGMRWRTCENRYQHTRWHGAVRHAQRDRVHHHGRAEVDVPRHVRRCVRIRANDGAGRNLDGTFCRGGAGEGSLR